MNVRRIGLATSLAICAARADAQSSSPLRPGTRVQVRTPSGGAPTVGVVATSDSARAILRVARGSVADVPWSRMTSVGVSRGIDRRAGAFRGLLAGVGLGAIWFVSLKREVGEDAFGVGTLVVGLTTLGIVPAIGALIGGGIAPERWEPVVLPASPPPARVMLQLSPDDDLRVRTTSGTLRGRAVRTTTDSLVIARGPKTRATSWNDVADLRVLGDRDRKRGAVRGALVITAITTIGVATDPLPTFEENLGVYVSNAAFGALIGAFFPMKRWIGLPVPGR